MSEVKLNIIDSEQVLHGTIHGSVADVCVAALSAEPESIAELEAALSRYIRPTDSNNHFQTFHSRNYSSNSSGSEGIRPANSLAAVIDTESWDAGLVIIDLAARIVASESTYSQPGPEGEVFYHDGHALSEVPILYRLPDDWLFVNSVDAYQWSRDRRALERAAKPAFDARPILFGQPLLEFLVNACCSLPAPTPQTCKESPDEEEARQEALAREVSIIHARWLLTPREDLRGLAPRDVLLEHQDFIENDLHTRSLQWSLQNEGPPCLAEDSYAYRFAGFGLHECVIYYDLVRHLIYSLIEMTSVVPRYGFSSKEQKEQLIHTLEQIKTEWLESPQSDLEGRIPAIVVNNERKRLPEAIRPRDMIIDDDCPMCRMLGDETSPLGMGVGFWHLDGSHMDDDFAFSFFKTRQEYELENRRREEFSREFERRWEERRQRIASGEELEDDPFFDHGLIGAGWRESDDEDVSEFN
jgi:hypothetical protein